MLTGSAAKKRWLTLGANFGVLLFLIAELNQTSEMNHGATRNQVASETSELLRDVGSSPRFAELIVKAAGNDELTAGEKVQYTRHTLSMLRYFENVHYQYRQELYDEEEFSTQREAWPKVYASSKPVVAIWCDFRQTFSRPYREEFDGLLSEHRCD